ncbi:Zn-dependent hydrolase [Thalassobacillus sp. CUG 92003]|uniref:Zn-dependent hydrolase n=1 Tax=Thalassobacillus sp. CUG 92003 TaxID=2736641 RepID=UPI0015E6F271|nr:Zn-dependent hydrolase [Thalassobacillus sp. CUG 92003]
MSEELLSGKSARLQQYIEKLATFIDQEKPGWTRRPFTKEYQHARKWLREQMEELGLTTHVDASSNLIGRWEGKKPDLAPIVLGSHIDTVTGGGRFDGIAGVVGALEVVRVLQTSGKRLDHTLEVIDFTAEEPSEYGISTIGSRGLVNNLTTNMLERKGPDGETLSEGIRQAGGLPEHISEEARQIGEVSIYLEMHIEQGPVLEQMDETVGIVTGIVGIHRYRVNVIGQPDHAGTTPMNKRCDALTAASELNLALEAICQEEWEKGVVGTVGRLNVKPNASNVIPGEINLDIDVRSLAIETLEGVMTKLKGKAAAISSSRGVDIKFDCLSQSTPIEVDDKILTLIEKASQQAVHTHRIPSGAGHDANQMANISPIAMFFIPSKDGKSHCPEEWTDYEDVARGVDCMVQSLFQIDSSLSPSSVN